MNRTSTKQLRGVGRPFLAYYAERREEMTIDGEYDEAVDVWATHGKPAVRSNELALDTVTFTKESGESTDRD